MKLKASGIYIALLCGSFLLSVSSTSAQKDKSKSANQHKSAPAQNPKSTPSPKAAPTPTPTLQGAYTLIDSAAATDAVNKAINAAVKPLGFFVRGPARDYLTKTNVPYQKIAIAYTRAHVSITTDQRAAIRTSVNGTPIDWTREDREKFKVSTVCESGKLRQTFQGENGQRVNAYSISADSKTLTMQVTITSTRLKHPLEYQLDYKRN